MAMILGRSTPDPRVGAPIELSGHDARGLLNLIRIGKALPGQGRIISTDAMHTQKKWCACVHAYEGY